MENNSEEIIGKRILLITAHPDDESFLAAGTIHANALAGGTTYLYSATAGEKGTTYMENPGDAESVKAIRMQELESVGKILSIEKIIVGSFPDREIGSYLPDLENEIAKVIGEIYPEIIIGFGENGYTGHEDHIVMGITAKKISRSLGIPYAAFSHPPKDICEDLSEHLSKKRSNGRYKDQVFCESPNIRVMVNSELKMQALQIYQTQFTGLDPYKVFPREIADHILSNEYFFLS